MEATYTSAELATIIAAIGVLVGSIFTGIVTVITALRNNKQTTQIKDAIIGDERNQGLIGQVREVHTLTNSNMTAANNKIDRLSVEIRQQQSMIQDLKQERDKREAAAAKAAAAPAPPGEPKIDMNVENMEVAELNVPPKGKK